MTAHVVFEALDAARPATLSPPVLALLRERCGFQGCCVSDDLEMKAIAGHVPLEVAAPLAVASGVDQLLVCHTPAVQHRAIDLVRQAVEDGRISEEPPRRGAGAGRPPPRLGRATAGSVPAPWGAPHREALALAARIPAMGTGTDPTAA